MIKVSALTGGQNDPSTRFRVRQHIESLRGLGIEVNEYVPSIHKHASIPSLAPYIKGDSSYYPRPIKTLWQGTKLATRIPGLFGSWNGQITWLLRELIPYRVTLEPLLKHPLIFDVDDAIWRVPTYNYSLSSPFGQKATQSIAKIAKIADLIIAGNSYLAEWFSQYNSKIKIIPTAINTDRFYPLLKDKNQSSTFVIGWTGSSGNLQYLYDLEIPLKRFMDQFSDSKLLVIADQPPQFQELSDHQVEYIPWSPETEVKAVQQMDVGLMPLADNDWTRGKCSFKMLQYMACGKPVIVSPVGMNAEILALDEVGFGVKQASDWYDALFILYKDPSLRYQYGTTGRKIIEGHFSQKIISAQLAETFKSFVN